MRFIVAPNFALAYDQRMVRSLAGGLHQLGHEAQALNAPIEDFALADVCRAYDPDVVIRVNHFRPLGDPLPPKVRHIAWFQDIFPETTEHVHDRIAEKDIVYVLGDPDTLGFNVTLPCLVGTLLSGVDETLQPSAPNGPAIDTSLCGFIPEQPPYLVQKKGRELIWNMASPPIRLFDRFGLAPQKYAARLRDRVPYPVILALIDIVEKNYQPLRGTLDIHQLATAMKRSLVSNFGYESPNASRNEGQFRQRGVIAELATLWNGEPAERWKAVERYISYLARDHARLLDRVALIDGILSVSKSLELYGPGWSGHPRYCQYHKGILDSAEKLANVYCRSRLNLANNTHGLGLHSRTLECMAVGGFIFTHASPADGKPGGMHTAFEPGVHYGMFTPETLEDDARRWLRDESKRKQAGAEASAIVRKSHTWRHRAEQILADLQR